jgi:oxygen-independent coproporphyrinogen-3 oxidase
MLAPMTRALPFDADLLRRYDRPGPRYTSYPTAPQFHDGFGEAALREAIAASNGDPIPRPLSLYAHIPFCVSPCFYCGCNRVITRDAERGARYLSRLQAEIRRIGPLFDRDRELVQIHLGGGTPNFLSPDQLGQLLGTVTDYFRLGTPAVREISIEVDPRTVTPADMGRLAAHGFDRASLGVQDFDPVVQAAVNRMQSVDDTRAIVEAAREHAFRSINIDLIYGLPRQTRAGFARTLEQVLAMRPDRLAVYSYAHLPQLFKPQQRINADDLPDDETKLGLLQLAIETLTAAGYEYIGMDHFALPDDPLAVAQRAGSLHRNFMGYTTHAATDLVGVGVSAISHIGDTYSQNPRDLRAWETAIDSGRLPVWRGLHLDADDIIRADLIQQLMCGGELDIPAFERRHGLEFAVYFHGCLGRLTPLVADGLVEVGPEAIRVTPRGRLLLRVVAAAFDRYLQAVPPAQPMARAV